MTLSPRQEKFCVEYARTGNGIESYKKSGYKVTSQGSANVGAIRLLARAEVKARLKELAEEMRADKIANAAEVQERLTRILRLEETEDVVTTEGCGDGVSETRIVQKRPALKDVIKAGETLAKMQGAFDGNVNVNVIVPVIGGEDGLQN